MDLSSLGRTLNHGKQTESTGTDTNPREFQQEYVNTLWTVGMEEMLIYFVRANRLLWDPRHMHFTKPMMKRKKVEDIADAIRREASPDGNLALTPEDVWKKYKNLRNFFVREVKRTCEKRREIGDDEYASKWVHFNRMRFLLTPLKLRLNGSHPNTLCQMRNNYSSIKKESQDISKAINDESARLHQDWREEVRVGGEWEGNSEQVSSSSTASARPTPSTAPQPEKLDESSSAKNRKYKAYRARVINSNDLEKAAKILRNLENNQGDVAEKFGRFVASSIRTLSEERQHTLMARITHVMSEFHKNND